MKNISLKSLDIRNFKGCLFNKIEFGDKTTISGANATGKTTIIDSFLWLLFGKDSAGSTNFGIRPVDETGKEIDNIEISVEAVLDVDGTEMVLKKVQKQKWTKHRGSTAPTFEGNVNSYEVDGFPLSEKEFKSKIAEIIPEDKFKLIADLRYFASLKWEEKKKLLLELCGDVSDEDVIAEDSERWAPIADDVLAAGVEKSKEKAKKLLRDLNKEQKTVPIRIDEISRHTQDVPNTSEFTRAMELEQLEITKLQPELDQLEKDASEAELKRELLSVINKKDAIQTEERNKLQTERNVLYEKMQEARKKITDVKVAMSDIGAKKSIYATKITALKESLKTEGDSYNEAKGRTFDTKLTVCKYCGQKLPENQIKDLEEKFKALKETDMTMAKETGWRVRKDLDAVQKMAEEAEQEEKDLLRKLVDVQNAGGKAETEYEAFSTVPDLTGNKEYQDLCLEEKSINEKIDVINEKVKMRDELRSVIMGHKLKIRECETRIMEAESIQKQNAELNARIEELTEEQRTNGQNIALTELKVMLLEDFSIRKSEMLSEKITGCFDMTNFKLFNQQINGGLAETCEIVYNGVPYRDMNSGHRICCALDIIKTFQKKLGISAPVFIDNSESVNDFNLPEMDCQLILLKVTDDEKLEVKI